MYFEAAGGEELQVLFEAKGKPPQDLASLVVAPTPKTPKPAEEAFQIKADLVAKGREYFTTLGCASCHSLKKDGEQVVAKPLNAAAALAELKGTGGCLNESSPKSPRYALDERQRAAITSAIA